MNRNPLFGLLLLAAVAEHAKKNDLPFGKQQGGKGGPGLHPDTDEYRQTFGRAERPIERKPLSRKLECPDCGQEVLLVRSITEGRACLDVHFLMDDGEHMVAGMLFNSVVDRDEHFMKLTYEDAKVIFSDMLSASTGLPLTLADLLGGLGRSR